MIGLYPKVHYSFDDLYSFEELVLTSTKPNALLLYRNVSVRKAWIYFIRCVLKGIAAFVVDLASVWNFLFSSSVSHIVEVLKNDSLHNRLDKH